ncbi:HK97 gp10 family phage protein [Rhizobium sp. 9140]|uniref:HK97 gp10 family phage protein n=1 Tax=Rhizobium sp. 9140 TaxID=1761900 RepID=UPI000791A371|nr:HK97 gp10 family phage protein [Rhizobium sp. 9140]CZT36139.1 phage protein, HK97 gp10 family [Rhizobium sp. 9140]
MAKVTIKIEGLKELDRALGQLPKSTGKAVLRKVLKDAGEPVAQAARANAPKLTLHLTETTDVGTKLTRRQASLHKKQAKDDRAFSEVFIGTSDPAGMQDEFGNEHQAAEPWLRPAWDGKKEATLDHIKNALWGEIERAAGRLARRAGRRR